jgi:hypothetical protein
MQSFYIALFQAEILLKALYIITPSQGPSRLPSPWEHTAELQIRGQRYTTTNAITTRYRYPKSEIPHVQLCQLWRKCLSSKYLIK